jgi:TRAP-type C4-dicarboxylate transport system substrate-binding protein
MSVAVALEILNLSRSTWEKIPKKDKERIKKAIEEKRISVAKRIAEKYHKRFKNPCPKPIHCKICGKAIAGTAKADFKTRMAKLRRHRKRSHPKAHKKSIKKAVRTRKEKE